MNECKGKTDTITIGIVFWMSFLFAPFGMQYNCWHYNLGVAFRICIL